LDAETGFYYFRNRYLNVGLGRFLTMDPSVLGRWEDRGNWGNPYTSFWSNGCYLMDPMGFTCQGGDGFKREGEWVWRREPASGSLYRRYKWGERLVPIGLPQPPKPQEIAPGVFVGGFRKNRCLQCHIRPPIKPELPPPPPYSRKKPTRLRGHLIFTGSSHDPIVFLPAYIPPPAPPKPFDECEFRADTDFENCIIGGEAFCLLTAWKGGLGGMVLCQASVLVGCTLIRSNSKRRCKEERKRKKGK